jgi:DNA-binding transcriptional LysR family regulator
MLKLESVAAFVAVAESGSISEAARRMELSKSVVSERLAELERSLGTKLLHRTTRKLAITEDGSTFYERAKRILQEATDAAVEIAERRGELVGPLRISGSVSFGSLHLGPALYGFLAKNPKIDLTLNLDDRFVSLLTDGYDAVVRHGPVVDEHVVVKRLAPSRRFLVAAPAYLERFGKPKSLAELERRVSAYGFARAHRQALVRVGGVRALHSRAGGEQFSETLIVMFRQLRCPGSQPVKGQTVRGQHQSRGR